MHVKNFLPLPQQWALCTRKVLARCVHVCVCVKPSGLRRTTHSRRSSKVPSVSLSSLSKQAKQHISIVLTLGDLAMFTPIAIPGRCCDVGEPCLLIRARSANQMMLDCRWHACGLTGLVDSANQMMLDCHWHACGLTGLERTSLLQRHCLVLL